MAMHVLGVAGFNHDATAALFRDGALVAAAQEERFTRVKHQEGFPWNAMRFCLREAGITEAEIDQVAYANNLWGPRGFRRTLHYAKNVVKAPSHSGGFVVRDLYTRLWITYLMKAATKGRARLRFVDHHISHMASAFLVSPFESAALFSIDSSGDGDTTVLGHGEGTRIRKLRVVNYPHAIAEVYCCVTNHLGFRTQDEYKVMGLASYGEPTFYDRMRKLVEWLPDGRYRVDPTYFLTHTHPGRFAGYVSQKFVDEFGTPRRPDAEITDRDRDFAASLQKLYEETVFHCLRSLHRLTGETSLCLSGGGALNSVTSGKIRSETPFTDVWVPPAPGDDGGAVGAAVVAAIDARGRRSWSMDTAYFGPQFSDAEIEQVLAEAKVKYGKVDDVATEAAALLARGHIVGWFQGRMEFGARALGSRSILADPTRPEMTDIVNRDVKHREDFRPFAPSITREQAAEFFELDNTPFMSFVTRVRADKRKLIPAVVHADATARPQTVEQHLNPLYWRLLREFEKRRGVPVVLNTSFNVKGEPIVCTPRDALRCYFSTGLDSLAIGSFILSKDGQPG
jgi:carbamoyltransferase